LVHDTHGGVDLNIRYRFDKNGDEVFHVDEHIRHVDDGADVNTLGSGYILPGAPAADQFGDGSKNSLGESRKWIGESARL
jgi:hypothetical protein